MMNMEVNIAVNIQATRKFYKVIVISVGLYESDMSTKDTLQTVTVQLHTQKRYLLVLSLF